VTLGEKLLTTFADRYPGEAAALLGEQEADDAADVLARLPERAGARVLERTTTPEAARALARLDRERAAALLGLLPLERAAAILRPLEPDTREALIAPLPTAARLRALIAYPPDTAGALMDPSVPALPADLEVEEARRRLGGQLGHLALEVYLLDPRRRPVAVADLGPVLDPDRTGSLASLGAPVEPVSEDADLGSLGAHPGWLRHGSLPVVDDRGAYVGAVRAKRVRQVAHEALVRRARGGADAVHALGELFWLGFTGLFSSLTRPPSEVAR
jgi:magnesium transporter